MIKNANLLFYNYVLFLCFLHVYVQAPLQFIDLRSVVVGRNDPVVVGRRHRRRAVGRRRRDLFWLLQSVQDVKHKDRIEPHVVWHPPRSVNKKW